MTELRRDIEGLRALSIISVVAYHFRPDWLSGGYLGVDVFFVISGYLITGNLLVIFARHQRLGDALQVFYSRRVRRLLPHALLVMLVTSTVGLALFSDFSLKRLGSDVFWSALYSTNWLYILRAADYLQWDDSKQGVLLHFWSLAIEEQFYLTWPIILFMLLRLRFRQFAEQGRGWVLTVTGALVVLSIAYCAWMARAHLTTAYFSTPARVWELLAGAAVALMPPTSRESPGATWRLVRPLALLLLLASMLGFDDETRHPGLLTVIPVLASAVLVHPLGAEARHRSWYSIGPLTGVGQRSYAIYLWHWPVLSVCRTLWPSGHGGTLLAAFVMTILLAEAGFRWVECPARWQWRISAKPRRVLVSALLATLLTAAVGFGLRALASTGARELLSLNSNTGTLASRLPTPQRIAADLPHIYENGCHVPLEAVSPKPGCIFGDLDGAVTVALFGDSHAAQWFPALDEVARSKGVRLLTMTKSGCPSVDISVWNGAARSPYTQCDEWRERAIEQLREAGVRRVILSNLFDETVVVADRDTGRRLKGREALQRWRSGLEHIIRRLQAQGMVVVLLRDTPQPRPDVQECLYAAAEPAKCELTRSEALGDSSADAEVARSTGATYWDLTDSICPAGRCPVVLPSLGWTVVYRDSNHLTASYVRSLAPELSRRWQ